MGRDVPRRSARLTTRSLVAALALAGGLAAVTSPSQAGVGAASTAARLAAMSIISPPPGHAVSDGGSDNTSFSQDNRNVRIVAFDSAATNLVPQDANGRRDVFALLKERGAAKLGGRLVDVSVATDGTQGNGDSTQPSVDGTTGEVPHCIAFQSTAMNLAPGARSHHTSVYLRDLKTHRTSLVSAGRASASDPSIDGLCRAVAYAAGGWVLLRDLRTGQLVHVARGENPDLETDGKGVAYDHGGQVYLQRIDHTRGDVLVRKQSPTLVSDTLRRLPGNGRSTNPAVDDHGHHIAFQSTATDLCTGRCPGFRNGGRVDSNGPISDVFERTLTQSSNGRFVPTMQLMSGQGVADQGNGSSGDPAISRAGKQVLFDSTSTNLDPYDSRGLGPSVYSWYWPGTRGYGVVRIVSAAPDWLIPDSLLSGPSLRPSLSSRGNYIAFTSFGTGKDGESNGPVIPDVFLRFMGVSSEGLPTH